MSSDAARLVDELRASLAAMTRRAERAEAALTVCDDALVAILNHRVRDGSHPLGWSNPISGPLLVQAERAVIASRKLDDGEDSA